MFRVATFDDLPRILEIYAYAREFMIQTGNPAQWGDYFPPIEMLEEDIPAGHLYVYELDHTIHGVFAFILGDDPTYSYIENGAWLSTEPYGTIHRIASDGSEKGFLCKCLEFCQTFTNHIRIDTHEDNVVMQKAIFKNGFQRCGIIYVEDGSPRIAYEYLQKK